MKKSWLVQRLERPRSGGILGVDNPFAFGGGYKNGGLSDEAMGLLRGIWAFDYMGAAEYEFGAVPEALNRIAKAAQAGDLTRFEFAIPLCDVTKNWRDKSKKKPEGDASVYVLCPAGWESEIEWRVRAWASDSRADDVRLRDYTGLAGALRPFEEWDTRTCGWLELDNGFLFFSDREMWEQACELFGVAEEVAAA